MSPESIIIPLFTHFVPILFFFYMGLDVWLRNPSKVEHRLVGITAACFLLLFLAEYVRHQLPIAYSARVTAVWFSSAGLAIPGLGFHLFVKLSQLDRKMPKYLYPYIFYLPLIIIAVNIITNGSLLSVTSFSEKGIWKIPEYNTAYYITMVACVVNNLLYLIPLIIGRNRAATAELRGIFNQLILGASLSAIWFAIFGTIQFGGSLPPYPYLYGGLVWCFFLRLTMRKYDFLNFSDKRYEKLFQMNPSAILLLDLNGKVRDVNPGAIRLFESNDLDQRRFYHLLSDDVRARIERQVPFRNAEMTIQGRNGQLDLLIDGDYVQVEHRPYVLLILRDITMQKKHQREITFLAYHDPLTRLPNRRYFHQSLEEAILQAEEQGEQLAVVVIDLDFFKEVNDKYGHLAGDEVLKRVAGVIQDKVGQLGMAARMGGDEFVFFMHPIESKQAVMDVMDDLLQTFSQLKLHYEGHAIPIETSIGAGFYPDDGMDADALLNNADKAMYKGKRTRKLADREISASSDS